MNSRLLRYSGIILMIVSLFVITYSAYNASITLLIFGILFMLVSVLFFLFTATLDIFRKDKQLDYKTLSDAGLTIIECPECQKKNVLEDKYCIFCGEKLVKKDESI